MTLSHDKHKPNSDAENIPPTASSPTNPGVLVTKPADHAQRLEAVQPLQPPTLNVGVDTVTNLGADRSSSTGPETTSEVAPNKCSPDLRAKLVRVVKGIVVDQLGSYSQDATERTDLGRDLNADSLDAIEITRALEDEFGLEIPDEDIEDLTSIGSIVDYLLLIAAPSTLDIVEPTRD